MRCFILLLSLALLSSPAGAELPCVTPEDAVIVMESLGKWTLTAPLSVEPSGSLRITCPPGKRVGLWIRSSEPVFIEPLFVEPTKIVGCEVGVVVETHKQALEGFTIRGARVGVCWQGDEGYMEAMTIEASEIGMIVSGKNGYFTRSRILVTSPEGGIKIQIQDDAACMCTGAV